MHDAHAKALLERLEDGGLDDLLVLAPLRVDDERIGSLCAHHVRRRGRKSRGTGHFRRGCGALA